MFPVLRGTTFICTLTFSSPRYTMWDRPRLSLCDLVAQSAVTEDLIRRSWVRFPPRSKDFFFASCGSLFPFIRANAQWVIHGFKLHCDLHFRVNSLVHYLCSQCYAAQHSYVPLLSLRRDTPCGIVPDFLCATL